MEIPQHLAVIGSGASAIYLLKHILDHLQLLKGRLARISIIEKSSIIGVGMPYSPLNTDHYHMANISSEELPELETSFVQWLEEQSPDFLESVGIRDVSIDKSEIYSRLALGAYLHSQYLNIVSKLRQAGIEIYEFLECEVNDIIESNAEKTFSLLTTSGTIEGPNRLIVATGHRWTDADHPSSGYYASPWPIRKILPAEGQFYNFAIGTIGASLSAFDVVSSLAHRHGTFTQKGKELLFTPHQGAENFKITMYASNAMLPHLQFAQVNPMRKIYRHIDRECMHALVGQDGFLKLDDFYERVCRPVLNAAFKKDRLYELVEKLEDPGFGLNSFIETMSAEHAYSNAFEGMRSEMKEAEQSVQNEQPIHWKEVMDDLFYTLNFHCELLSAEDHLRLRSVVMPFLLNVIAAMPLASANAILALYDAGVLNMIPGKVTVSQAEDIQNKTNISIDHDGQKTIATYQMFIDCTGQKPLELNDYPFPSLVQHGLIRKARARFLDPAEAANIDDAKKPLLLKQGLEVSLYIGGIDIDAAYRVIGQDGIPHPRIYDIAFPHTPGLRPYSYGLQACSAASEIVVRAWVEQINTGITQYQKIEPGKGIYEKI